MKVEGVVQAELVGSGQLELAHHQFPVAQQRLRVPQFDHHPPDRFHLLAPNEQIDVPVRPQARGLVDRVSERRALEKNGIDVAGCQRVEHRDDFLPAHELRGGGRVRRLLERVPHVVGPVAHVAERGHPLVNQLREVLPPAGFEQISGASTESVPGEFLSPQEGVEMLAQFPHGPPRLLNSGPGRLPGRPRTRG